MARPSRGNGAQTETGWTPRGIATTALVSVLGLLLVLSHLGVSPVALAGSAVVAVVAATMLLPRLPADTGRLRRTGG